MHNAYTDELMNPLSIVNCVSTWHFEAHAPMELLMDFSSSCAAFITLSEITSLLMQFDVIFIFSFSDGIQCCNPSDFFSCSILFSIVMLSSSNKCLYFAPANSYAGAYI